MHSPLGTVIPQILDGLRHAGVAEGNCLVVHSSLKSLGLADATPSDVIRTLSAAVGVVGTLVMPTFTYSYAGIFGVQPFHRDKTPGLLNGILTETLRQYPGALRSEHPTYSVAALGQHARQITQGKAQASALGIGSSYDEAAKLGAKILLLGVGNARNSMLHYAEVVSGLPYNAIPFREFWGRTALVERDGRVVEVALKEEFPGCSARFGTADDYLTERGIAKRVRICQSDSMLISAADMVRAVVERLREEPAWLLCDSLACEPCNRRKQLLRERGLL